MVKNDKEGFIFPSYVEDILGQNYLTMDMDHSDG